ncbi:MAG: bifunctional oligoribonuclease/PAP phosphatase NrnA, partial [Christensenellales bacterium]
MTKEIKDLIDRSKSVAVFFHVGPDGDAIGSGLAIKYALEQLGKDVTIFSQDEIGERMWFLDTSCVKTEIVSNKFDLAFALDVSEVKRIGIMADVLKNCKEIINIDHHLDNENFTKFKIVDADASSTCELVCEFLKDLGVEFTKQIRFALYCGLATDTGCFMYSTRKQTYNTASFLTDGIC